MTESNHNDCDRYIPTSQGQCHHYLKGTGSIGCCSLGDRITCTLDVLKFSPHLSHSAIQTYTCCKRKYFHRYIARLSIKPRHLGTALKMGSIWDTFRNLVHTVDRGDRIRILKDLHKRFANYGTDFRQYRNDMTSATCGLNVVGELRLAYDLDDTNYAKVRGVCLGYIDANVQPDMTSYIGPQVRFKKTLPIAPVDEHPLAIVGVFDHLYEDHFIEAKFSGRPANYCQSCHNLESQIGTYFLTHPHLEYCIMEIVRVPDLRLGKNESIDAFEDRVREDVVKRPGHYFLNYKKATKQFGHRFYRREFDLDGLLSMYRSIQDELRWIAERDAWYKNHNSCRLYGFDCDYLPICETGVISEEIYELRQTGDKPNETVRQG